MDNVLQAVVTVPYTNNQAPGVTALAVSGFISLIAILGLAVILLVKACKAARYGGDIFPQTHIAPYFVSLLLANLIQSIGSVLNLNWLSQGGTVFDHTCVAQGITKNIGNVGSALWSLVIALHIFNVLFLRQRHGKKMLWATIAGIWIVVFCVDMFGPVILQRPADGPFFGISGYWCWITESYPLSRIFLEYIFMFVSAFSCGVIYILVFLRLRGNLSGEGREIRFRRILKSERWAVKLSRDELDGKMYKVARQLMFYPLVYSFVITPIAVARFIDSAGNGAPFWFTIFADFFFNLNGFFNVIIFTYTFRKVQITYLPSLYEPRKSIIIGNFGITPFILSSRPSDGKDETNFEVLDLEKGEGDKRRESVSTVNSVQSVDSTAPLTTS